MNARELLESRNLAKPSALSYEAFLERKAKRLGLPCLAEMESDSRLAVWVRDMGVQRRPPTYIYGLIDPSTDQIRYIGKSNRPAGRLADHLNERSNCHRSHWLQSLKARGLRPKFTVLEAVWPGQSWQDAERRWIAFGRSAGWPLTNNTSGGDGVAELPPATRERMRQVWLGRKHSPATIERLKAARALRPRHSDETRAKMSAAQRGRTITWGEKIAGSVRKLDEQQVAAIKRRLDAGELGKDLAAEYGVHRTTLSKIKTGTYFERYRRSAAA